MYFFTCIERMARSLSEGVLGACIEQVEEIQVHKVAIKYMACKVNLLFLFNYKIN